MMANSQQLQGMQLAELLAGLPVLVPEHANVFISGLQLDSRKVQAGDLFVACQGAAVNGQDFIPQAVAQGAVAVLTDSEYAQAISIPVVVLPAAMTYMSEIAGRYYGQPSAKMPLIGVTGTNGKTSCTQFMMQLLNQLQKSCGVIGTLGAGIDGQLQLAMNTTPDAIALQQQLAEWQSKTDCVAMEVSSHGLAQGRVAALQFDVALFTNLTRDHLDYHGDMASYGAEKAKLFKQPGLKTAVINIDDNYAETLLSQIDDSVDVVRYSLSDQQAEVYASDIRYHEGGLTAQVHSPWGDGQLSCSLYGHFNLSNVLAAVTCLAAQAYDFAALIAAAKNLQAVAGRMEMLNAQAAVEEPVIVIDYAHTPDALAQALKALRLHASRKLHCVFGCGGDRDKGKRPLMGQLADQLADVVWVTSDNPRSENAEQILQDITAGMRSSSYSLEVDRAAAIEKCILSAQAGDVILIAGKGHEDYQQVGDQRLPFNDAVQARLALRKRWGGQS